MSDGLMVLAPDEGNFSITGEQFRAAVGHWQPYAEILSPLAGSDADEFNMNVRRPGDPPFHIYYSPSRHVLFSDGTAEQAVEVAVWAVNAFPRSGPGDLWLVDEAYTRHVVLTPGITAADIEAGWQLHE